MAAAVRFRSWWKPGLLLAFLAGAIYFLRGTEAGQAITPNAARAYFATLEPWWARLLYVLGYIVGTVLLFPGAVLSFVGAVLFGIWEGTLYTWIGATTGATLAYFVARWLGRDFVEGLLGGRFQAFDRRLRAHGFTGLLILRLVPLFPFNGINFGSGLTSIRPRDYVLATAVGILPGTFIYQFLFTRLTEGLTWADVLDPILGLALGLWVVFIFLGQWLAGGREEKPPRPS